MSKNDLIGLIIIVVAILLMVAMINGTLILIFGR